MNDLLQLPVDLAQGFARGAVRRVLSFVPPTDHPGLDPDVARVSRVVGMAGAHRTPVPLLRLGYELDARLWQAPPPDGVTVTDEQLALPADPSGPDRTVTVRTYVPAHTRGPGVLVYVHGGGFSIGSLDTHDAVCRRLAVGAGATVRSVSYRLAPEHPFPAGLTDIAAAWSVLQARHVAAGGDPRRIGIGGDSAGGHAAATVADEAARPTLGIDVPMPGFCWMVYPGVRTREPERLTGLFPTGVPLTGAMVGRFSSLYAPDPALHEAPALNPLDVPDEVLAAHPPTWVQTVRFDPLEADGRAYVDRLRVNGVEVEHDHDDAMAHGYISMTGVSTAAAQALGRGTAALRRLAHAG